MGPLTPTPLMDTIYDLIEEAKLRFLWWALCIFSISYFFTHTSKSMWMNIPISIVFVAALRILSNKVEFHWKVQPPTRRTYLSHLEKKQLSPNDGRLSSSPPRPKWKKKIDSPVVEAALNDFIDLILKDFVVDLWYSEITSDREFPEQIRDLVMDALAEVTGRVKEINLVDLITRDIVDLIGDHIDLFRRNQAAIGVDVMLTLSSEERDERLKFHLLNSKELHPALISPESSSAASEWGISYSAKTTRSSMSGHSIYSSGNYNLLGIATCFGFGKPWSWYIIETSADWAQMLEAATQRRTEVLMPENLDNMWTKGKNYNRKKDKPLNSVGSESQLNVGSTIRSESSLDPDMELCFETARHQVDEVNDVKDVAAANKCKVPLMRSNSASALGFQTNKGGSTMSEFYTSEFEKHGEGFRGKSGQGHFVPKLRCRVMGAYFEKLSSKSFAVYSIAVTNGQEKTWFVKRRYRNFERLHRHLKEIPNYTLHLPPKRIFYSSTEDAFVHQRCIQLNKYLQDLLSIANVAEQHEVWDFLSVSSKSYSFGKSSSMMRTLAVNVDDAVDDIARQFKGVPNGLIRKAGCSTSPTTEGSVTSNTWNSADELDKNISRHIASESVLSSDNEQEAHVGYENIDGEVAEDNGWHSDNELSSKDYSQQVVNHGKESSNLDQDRKHDVMMEAKVGKDVSAANLTLIPDNLEDPDGVPPEWTPPNVSVPILNLVDNIFQLKKRGWLRRQVFWISKQILQLVMEDAIDDCLLREIHWLRREDTVAQGIRWIQDILWPGGTFFVRLRAPQVLSGGSGIDQKLQTLSESGGIKMAKSGSGSFEQQLEAARRASDVKKLLFDGAPAALVSLIGQKQYRRCASDIYYFSQSSICVKQLAYAIFELLLISIFPEMRNVVMSVHENMHVHQPV
ncbi:PREDICTED: uncharacterized protein LOC109330697 isoform X4 [Lupinus angustifolius]|uniref:uncharacterized protein LOC109330697 isoform X4 n=1 Tax=Lupinus angustifolius TaxID=3871 RepID=UPI00092F249B|nr:PREDICTED: uncharacterized protein LOC109330697 isoform X4 [Lupinus angustifolius]